MESQSNEIFQHRAATEVRLARLLQMAEIDLPIAAIKSVILDYHHTRFTLFFAQMTAMFKSAEMRVDKAVWSIVIQDAWNYFPHLSLDGRCPAEIMAENMRTQEA